MRDVTFMTGNGEQEGGDLIPIGNEVEPHGFLRGRDDELLHHVVGVHHDFDALGLEQGKHSFDNNRDFWISVLVSL